MTVAIELLDLEAPRVVPPRASHRLRPPLTRQRFVMWAVIVGFAAATIWAWMYVDMSFTRIWSGLGDMRNLLDRMLPPNFERLDHTISLAFQTLWMAVIADTGASLIVVANAMRLLRKG